MLVQEHLSPFFCFKDLYDNGDPSHDWLHIERVVGTCLRFGKELNANLRLLVPAAVLHDVVNVPKNSKDRAKASAMAAEKAQDLLKDFDYTEEELKQIGQIILEHSYSANITPSSLESAILQDADKLDSMGAIGVMRWTTVGTRMGALYYSSDDPYADQRELDDFKYSLDHFERKLLRLFDRLNTDLGKSEGQKRVDFFHAFLEQLKGEILS